MCHPAMLHDRRDEDTTSTAVGSSVAALHGESGMPAERVEPVRQANREEFALTEAVAGLSAVRV